MDFQEDITSVRTVLQAFQEGYSKRDGKAIDAFLNLFVTDEGQEVIGTSAVSTANEEWCKGQSATRALVAADWESWGDLVLDVEAASIHVNGDVAWLSTTGTVSQTIPLEHTYEGMAHFLQRFRKGRPEAEIEEDLLNVILGAASALSAKLKGESYVWPLRFTAVLVKQKELWKFHQIHFSYPTIHLPQVRLS